MSGLWKGGTQKTEIGFPCEVPADYYLYQKLAVPVVSSTCSISDTVISVVSSTGVVAGQTITFYEGRNMFQSLVTGTTATTISISSPIDFEYTSEALVETGLRNMNVNGAVTPQIFSIKAPTCSCICIHTINCSILDSSAMDDGMFGGFSQLSNGILFRFINSSPVQSKNLAVIVNNMEFWEIGFDIKYSDKAPSGKYGFKARRNIPEINGVRLNLKAGGTCEFQVHVKDDLTSLDLLACSINGYMKI